MASDAELLHRYLDAGAEDAFAAFVGRYINLVYSSALRQLGDDAHLAHDVTQLVFLTAARKARSLATHPVLAGWLYNTTHHIAARTARQERSRYLRERKASQMNERIDDGTDVAWEQIRPTLDRVLQALGERDRQVVVMRYFAGCSFAEIGSGCGITEDAARMRVDRALDKLRRQFSRFGITSTTAVIANVLTRYAVAAAPSGLTSVVAHSAVTAAAAGTGFGYAGFHVMTSAKTLLAGALVTGVVITGGLLIMRHAANASAGSFAAPRKPAETATVSPRNHAPSHAEAASVVGTAPTASPRGTLAFVQSTTDAKPPVTATPTANGAIPMSLADMVGPNNRFHDDAWGVSMTYPKDWKIVHGMRWGQNSRENTLFMSPDVRSTARPSMYYQDYRDQPPTRENAETYLRGIAEWKEKSRVKGGQSDYQNVPESFAFNEIDGHPAMSYFATFSQGNDVRTEYFIRILGQNGYVMFFTTGRLEDVKPLMPAIEQMAASVKLP